MHRLDHKDIPFINEQIKAIRAELYDDIGKNYLAIEKGKVISRTYPANYAFALDRITTILRHDGWKLDCEFVQNESEDKFLVMLSKC